MKNEYQSPEFDVEIFESNDVLATSGGDIFEGRETPFNILPENRDIFST